MVKFRCATRLIVFNEASVLFDHLVGALASSIGRAVHSGRGSRAVPFPRATPGRPLCDRPVGERRERGHLSDEWTEDQATDGPYHERERELGETRALAVP